MNQERTRRQAGRIEDHGVVGNMRSAVLVDRDGAVDWMCLPRFDSAAHFASLVGTEEHGLWRIGPATADGASPVVADRRRYLVGTLILESTFVTPDGTVRLLDFMPPGGGAAQMVRIVRGVSGRVAMRSLLRARPGHGITVPYIGVAGRRVSIDLDDGRLWLDTAATTVESRGDLCSEFAVSEGDEITFTLSWEDGQDGPPPLPDAAGLMKETADFWRRWVGQSTYAGPHQDAVEQSLIILKALTYAPSGAMVAAATTSLPEEIGGVRNWDYTACWLRDSAFVVETFLSCGFTDEARAWIDWLRKVIDDRPERLQIMYGVTGERDLTETVLDWLPGHEGSAPVRRGNAAAKQLQIDVYGEVISALYEALLRDASLAPVVGPLITGLAGCLEKVWALPDEGIWEVRGARRHFVHSKVMAWTAFDRAVKAFDAGYIQGPVESWRALREQIHAEVCAFGYDEHRTTFVQSYGSAELDAALLHALGTGFLPPTDKRVTGTIEAVRRDLSVEGGFLLRYHTRGAAPGRDGLPGDEGAFLICSGWMITGLAKVGRVDEAEVLLDGLLRTRNDLGLMSEEWDPRWQRQLGNLPQAFSHLALVRAVLALHAARGGQGPGRVEESW
ncbi:glycoside hydrolase family 15 protein [Streptomyces sp. NPDC058417]|uniref:glycoside hydrolase family 15 protein n=1 Tax=unclassified Streptomyces TaxID=2593676 RepID=UPI00364A4689